MSTRTAGVALGGILAAAIGGGALMLHGQHAAHSSTASNPATRQSHPAPVTSPSARPSPAPTAQPPVTVEGIVRLQPLDGWRVRTFFLTHQPPYLRLVKHQVRINVLAGTFDGSIPQLADDYASQFVLPYALGSARTPVRHWVKLPSGAVALKLTYSGAFAPLGTSLVHELTVVMHGSHGVVFDGWGTPELVAGAQAEVDRMVDRAVVL